MFTKILISYFSKLFTQSLWNCSPYLSGSNIPIFVYRSRNKNRFYKLRVGRVLTSQWLYMKILRKSIQSEMKKKINIYIYGVSSIQRQKIVLAVNNAVRIGCSQYIKQQHSCLLYMVYATHWIRLECNLSEQRVVRYTNYGRPLGSVVLTEVKGNWV